MLCAVYRSQANGVLRENHHIFVAVVCVRSLRWVRVLTAYISREESQM